MKNRRKLLKGLALNTAWATPVVSSVVLPVHATLSFFDTLECSEPGSLFVISNQGPSCGEVVTSNTPLQATFAFNPPTSDVSMAGVTLCNGSPTEVNYFNSDEGLGTNVTPANEGCFSGTITIRLYRLDNGCSAECSWTISDT